MDILLPNFIGKLATHFFTPINSEKSGENKEARLVGDVVRIKVPAKKSLNYSQRDVFKPVSAVWWVDKYEG
jgi:uncharacterized membrane protein